MILGAGVVFLDLCEVVLLFGEVLFLVANCF